MPACSPCGMAVEWMRQSYSSEWHFFGDAPEVTTPGRYYFVRDDTPCVPVYHHYGARVWHETNWPKGQGLGESLTARHTWNAGASPELMPRPDIVGELACITNGESIANRLPYDQIWDGFSRACFFPEQLVDDTWPLVSTISSCSLQYFYATILAWMYHRDWASIERAFDLLVPGASLFHQDGNEFYPSLVCVVTDAWAVLVSDGTQTYQQWALQAFYGISPPEEFGLFGTLRLWYEASTRSAQFMKDCGANPFGKFMLAGHSYGGANVSLLAARLIAAGPHRVISLLTFGTPKPGDRRVRSLLLDVNCLNLANEQDIVTVVPPDLAILWPVLELTALFDVLVWAAWEGVPGRARMDADGNLAMNLEPTLDSVTLLRMLTQIVNGEPIFDIVTHPVTVYRTRIKRRCPDREWPVDLELWRWLNTYDLAALTELQIGASFEKPALAGLVVGGLAAPKTGIVVDGDTPFKDAALTGLVVSGDGGEQFAPLTGLVVSGEDVADVGAKIGFDVSSKADVGLVVGATDDVVADVGLVVGAPAQYQDVGLVVGAKSDLTGDSSLDVGAETTNVEPGTGCPSATPIAAGTSFTWTTSTTDEQWLRFNSASLPGLFHIRLTSSVDFVGADTYFGTSCALQFFMETLTTSAPCADHIFFGGEEIWIKVRPTATPVVYVITTGTGAC